MTGPTGLQQTIDGVIASLQAHRGLFPCNESMLSEDDPTDLRALAELSLDMARVFDKIYHEIAYRGGLSSRSGASPHANLVTCAIEGNLDCELRDRAEEIEADMPDEDDAREHGTLNHAQTGVGR